LNLPRRAPAERVREFGCLGFNKQARQIVDITSVVEACCESIRSDYPGAVIGSTLDSAQHVVAHQSVESAVMNVVENAVEHNDKQTPYVTVESRVVSDGGTEYVELRIADDGPGIAADEIEVLERGYETDLEHTSGLGLWLVSWIVGSAGGEVRFEANEPDGSVVCLRMKRAGRSQRSFAASHAIDAATS
jgi:signal transduction histidine kinase